MRFFRLTLHDPRLAVCFREIQTLERQREDEGASGKRDAFDRLLEMRKFAVAQGNAPALVDLQAAFARTLHGRGQGPAAPRNKTIQSPETEPASRERV